ncbi:TIR-like protein FxsC [Streptosporangium sp. G11]|uniref:TIR-like protein FxsC n=1 Tax=Streptosporangium sp. G11 TaxID=3436926 RepID=UPI003EB7B28A
MNDMDSRPYFFVSHSSVPISQDETQANSLLHRIYHDLLSRVIQFMVETASPPVGFIEWRDRSTMPPPSEVVQAVMSCRVLVPLYSKRYFEDRRCAAEWSLFQRRVEEVDARHSVTAPIVPAIWTPVDVAEIPEEASAIPFDPIEFGSAYAEHGLYGLASIERFRPEYLNTLDILAKRIVDIGSRVELPRGRNTFTDDVSATFSGPAGRFPLRIIISAWTSENLPEGRDHRPYGTSPLQWNPYHPNSTKSIGESAAHLVRNLGYDARLVSLDDTTFNGLLAENVPEGPGLLILDPTMLSDPDTAARVRAFDELRRPWIRVMIPMGVRGTSASDNLEHLQGHIESMLSRRSREDRLSVKEALSGIPTVEAFEAILPRLVEIASRQYLRARTTALPEPGRASSRVRLPRPALFDNGRGGEENNERP